MIVRQEDERFTHITRCKIVSLYKKIPAQFGGYLLQIKYKIKDDDLFNEYKDIIIDQSKFLSDIIKLLNGEVERIYFTFGMGDIDIFKRGDDYIIYWSPNDGIYHYYFFSEEEFKKLKTWIELENEYEQKQKNNIS